LVLRNCWHFLPDVIVANANPATSALHQASRTVPIAFTVVTDPVGEGFVQNFARPGGNITGFTNQPTEGAKFLELLSEIAPGVRRVLHEREHPDKCGHLSVGRDSGTEIHRRDFQDRGARRRRHRAGYVRPRNGPTGPV
jgi:hypothetical protein